MPHAMSFGPPQPYAIILPTFFSWRDSSGMLEVINLSCVRDERTLFHGLSFGVAAGDIVQIEGPNGAGKTSLLRLLAGLSRPEEGEVRWQSQPIRQQREQWHQSLLFLGHQPGVKAVLSPLENLRFCHPNRNDAQIFDALECVDLLGYEEVPVAQLSAGQQRRVALARLWLSDAALWILDEPLTAIDKAGVEKLMKRFTQHAEKGGLVILTTHQDLPESDGRVRKIALTGAELL
ncbi:cytochrome c biogenesis heme-transporting ATPase CcmA [Pantoea tagorei]